MKTAKVIIGGAFGDEGKGLFTDYLAAESEAGTCVVRFNGGAQAGHTVQTPEGRRHVFGHFGSGSLAGLPTFLSSYFVCNPVIFLRELRQLAALGVTPCVYADKNCAVTTPYDMMINQIVEQARGKNRHGSVGVGFGETLERQQNTVYALRLDDLQDADGLRRRLDLMRADWVPKRLAALGVTDIGEEWQRLLASETLREHFIDDAAQFLAAIRPVGGGHLAQWEHVIFEGAQGLLLDQERGWFPHVTRSYTGIRNVLTLAEAAGLDDLDVYYLTRSYTTRHGAGPLPHELPHLPYAGIVDETNRPNAYQGVLRFAWFDLDLFRDTVLRDLGDGQGRLTLRPHLAMSCLDQIEGEARYIAQGRLHSAGADELYECVRCAIGGGDGLASYGPTRAAIVPVAAFAPHPCSAADIGNRAFEALNVM
ncbi:MAG: adenylosuccinate synthetase [Alphaproteobacteria bacterium]|nr:adenylosuccinate synthetase [Alphaproteobacteria bacterium]